MSPSFLEQAALARVAVALGRQSRPALWRRETAWAAARLRPEVLILSAEAAGLRAAWALAQVSGTARLCGLRWDQGGRPWARAAGLGAPLRFEVRELAAGMGGGALGALRQALQAPPETPGLIVFLSAGWEAAALEKAVCDPHVRGRAAQWRRCHLLANGRSFALHPRSRLGR